jgi:hypothetical protein
MHGMNNIKDLSLLLLLLLLLFWKAWISELVSPLEGGGGLVSLNLFLGYFFLWGFS